MPKVAGTRSRRLKRLLDLYLTEAAGDVTRAAELAGYRSPAQNAYRLKRAHPELFAEAEAKFREQMLMGSRELDERITSLARDPKHRDHFKALELLARMAGKLTDKVNVTIERPALNLQLDEIIRQMVLSRASQQGIPVAIEAVGDAVPLLPPISPADKGDDKGSNKAS